MAVNKNPVTPVAARTSPADVQSSEQLLYARLVEVGAWLGILVLLVTFALFSFGWVDAQIPPDKWPQYWDKPVAVYLEKSGAQTGWGWFSQLGKSDTASLLGVAVLAGCSMVALLSLLPTYLRRRDHAFTWIVIFEVLILLLAASGLVGAGH